jgi:hypothetical protein
MYVYMVIVCVYTFTRGPLLGRGYQGIEPSSHVVLGSIPNVVTNVRIKNTLKYVA